MTLLGHLIRTDVRRLRLLLAALALLTVGGTGLAIAQPLVPHSRRFASLAAAGSLVWIAKMLATLITSALLVHGHALVGTTAFWMTRPIPRMVLLASKAAALSFLVIALPVACELLFMSLYDVPPGRMALVAVQTAFLQLLWMIVLMCGASVTRNIAGFGLLVAGAVVAVAILFVMLPLFLFDPDGGVAFVAVSAGPPALTPDDPGGDLLFAGLVLAAGIAMLVVQYRTRSRLRSTATAAAGVAIACLIATYWPWPLLPRERAVPQWATASPALLLSGDAAAISFHDESHLWGAGERKWRSGRARMHVDGVEPGWRTRARLASSSLALADGTRIEGRGMAYGEEIPIGPTDRNPERFVMRALLDVDRLGGLGDGNALGNVALVIASTNLVTRNGAAGTYTGTFILDLTRVEIAATLPLQPGASYQEGAARFQIDHVAYSPTLIVRARRSNASAIVSRRPARSYSYYLRNRSRREAATTSIRYPAHETVWFPFAGAWHVESSAGFGVSQELITPMTYTQEPPDPSPRYAFEANREWMAGAELVIVRTTEAGSVIRTLERPGARIEAAN